LHPDIEAYLVTWWQAAGRVYNAEWTQRPTANLRKDEHGRLMKAELEARDGLYKMINYYHGPKAAVETQRITIVPDNPDDEPPLRLA